MADIKTAMFGGSFDPIHLGHLFLLHTAVENTDYNRFVIVPAYMSNFKQDTRLSASPAQRLEMIDIALEDYSKLYPNDRNVEFVVCEDELNRKGVSYTIDTVNSLISRYNLTDKLGMIIGDDHIERLGEWHKFEELKSKVQFLICPRNSISPNWSKLPEGLDYIKLTTSTLSPESATRVRENIKENIKDLSEGVGNYVRKNNLYS